MSNTEGIPNQLELEAQEYLRKNRINELFEDLCTEICFHQPENVKDFMINSLKEKQKQGFKHGVFAPQEIKNIFTLFDLKKNGIIDKQTCREALKAFATSELQWTRLEEAGLPEEVNFEKFEELVQNYFFKFDPSKHERRENKPKINLNNVDSWAEELFKQKELNQNNSRISKEDLINYSISILRDGGYPNFKESVFEQSLYDLGFLGVLSFSYNDFATYLSYVVKKVQDSEHY
ncbi:Dimerization-anchoring domain of cAMP-dependent protein kinase, regulatory subunit [Pseudocohnilembus persalinus]|uniref:Dimerization-anchoring domain of cAMP-dependent protein kinase, regulatory subunit n=1 Tax=Pseudocohnilembus persalinus TaxID=266149 RepID=A0A0V0R7J7_PSEPJ|nr:Dimerization-anchoring domain of cAMP-dependent protein kinase, regulatory subunit [Pseudocohnilembus persalinus]|eukprot:KRX10478.1 Dimerization-anchoring domain of cAMP-dependent protein kinase, regulatory subunit [Pseudocohnilembus persalinus]